MMGDQRVKLGLRLSSVFILFLLLAFGRPIYQHFTAVPALGKNMEVTHVTSGTVKADVIIAVRFKEAQVSKDLIGKELKQNPFIFTPRLVGRAYWADSATLAFEPAQPLYRMQDYSALLKLEDGEEFKFSFSSQGQEVLGLSGYFESDAAGQEEEYRFVAEISFREKVSSSALAENLELLLDETVLDWEVVTEDNVEFRITSERVARGQIPQLLRLQAQGKALGLAADLQGEYELSSRRSPLKVLGLDEEKEGEFSRLRLMFSDRLMENRDYSGYLTISPSVNYTVQAQGSMLVIRGEFRPREKYEIKLFPGITSAYGEQLSDPGDFLWEVQISDLEPRVQFIDEGQILTNSSAKRVAFRSMNVARLRLQVKKVEEENLIFFFEENSYRPAGMSFEDYNRYSFLRLGEIVEDRIIEVGWEPNKWIRSELDLSRVIGAEDSSLYIIQLDFDETQALSFPTEFDRWDISYHVSSKGRAVKHILISDLGITAKEMLDDLHVFVTDLLSTEPLSNAEVLLRDREGNLLDHAYSDETGRALLQADQEGYYLEVRSSGGFGLIRLPNSQLNLGLFDIGGLQKQDGVNAFIYTERGVYRPGDQINLCAILRNEDDTFPENHPITWRLYNPQDQLILEKTVLEGEDGFYRTELSTEPTAPTGNWRAVLDVGGRLFSKFLRIEEIVPYRIRVEIQGEVDQPSEGAHSAEFSLHSEYLFGAPARGLESEVRASIQAYEQSFEGYPSFMFNNQTKGFAGLQQTFYALLDDQGAAHFSLDLPEFSAVPSALRLSLEGRVYESGGRFVPAVKTIPLEHYPSYVGISTLEDPDLGREERADFEIVHLSAAGEPLVESELEYSIYKLRNYWWWEYSSENEFRRYFKQNEQLILEKQGSLVTDSEGRAELSYHPEDYGEIVLEVQDPQGGHSSAYFFRSYWWADAAESSTPGALTLKLDQESYRPGDVAHISLDAPLGSRALLTVEKEGKLLEQRWHEVDELQTVIALDVKKEYLPNAYVSVLIYQPYGQKENDLPLRLYGVAPLMVESEGSEIKLNLKLPQEIRPQEKFSLEIQTDDGLPVQFTVAVVDEGILNITGFETPAPWRHFYHKQRLLTKNYDNYSDVIDLSLGYIHNIFTVGGDVEEAYRQMQTPDQDAVRFEAVSVFEGPFFTDEKGFARVELELPNYLGSVRVMVVAASGGRYGHAQEDLTVKAPLMVLSSLPRILRPGDRITVPVSVFALEEGVGEVEVTCSLQGPVQLEGPAQQLLQFEEEGEQEAVFRIRALEGLGTAQVAIAAKSQDYQSEEETNLPLRAPNPHIYVSWEELVDPGQEALFITPPAGIEGTDSTRFSISPWRGLNINHRINWLVRYPYGCLEQITSAVFPQLYLGEVFDFEEEELLEMDEHINAAILAFRQYQLSSGGFSYWPGGGVPEFWSTNYAGHFLLEAKGKGYHVPADLFARWLDYQEEAARSNRGDLYTRAYRLYLLALADSPQLSALNYMRESEFDHLGNVEKHLLAAAYRVLGFEEIGETLKEKAGKQVALYQEIGGTFGSTLRDRALLLDVLIGFGDYSSAAPLYDQIASDLASNRWYSTQATAFGLMAVTKYVQGLSAQASLLSGELFYNEKTFLVKEAGPVAIIPLEVGGGQLISFKNTTSAPLFATLEWEGIPRPEELREERSKLILSSSYFDPQGKSIDISEMKQGSEFYALYRVGQEGYEHLSELALVQMLPAGWEIENIRLLGGDLPHWAWQYNLERENYLDLRDDRAMWFFDFPGWMETVDFLLKLNAVTVGEYVLPPTLVEAMYDNNYKVITAPGRVKVLER